MSFRSTMRHGVLSSLSAIDRLARREDQLSQRRVVQVVNFHHMYPREVKSFRRFLEWFSSHYEVVPYSQATASIQAGNVDKSYGAITFDDGLKSIVTAGKVLAEHNISATFFVCPSIVGEVSPNRLREFCVSARMDYESDEFVSWSDIDVLKNQHHEIGNHTHSHKEIALLNESEIVEELSKAQELLTEKVGAIKHFAWPFGRFENLGQDALQPLLNAGFTSIASGERGAHGNFQQTEDKLPLCIRRDNVEARWPLGHIKYFLIRNAINPIGCKNWWPDGWNIDSQSTTSSNAKV